MTRKTAFSALAGFFLATASLSAGNIVVNPGFESGALSPWTGSWSVDSNSHSGSFAAVIGNDGSSELVQSLTPTLSDSIDSATFWINQSSGGISYVEFFYSDHDTTGGLRGFQTGSWQQVDVTSLLVAGATVTGFGIYGAGTSSGNTNHVDDVIIHSTLADAPEPGTIAMVLGGMGLLLVRRRMRGAC